MGEYDGMVRGLIDNHYGDGGRNAWSVCSRLRLAGDLLGLAAQITDTIASAAGDAASMVDSGDAEQLAIVNKFADDMEDVKESLCELMGVVAKYAMQYGCPDPMQCGFRHNFDPPCGEEDGVVRGGV